ncbi:uncharacterized protein [Ptychodera flava]|uniref:uncharacterized protein isoform X2 n=1 Tax=Ptychodera flava TaxID=63121 RepID=UPI00396A32FD
MATMPRQTQRQFSGNGGVLIKQGWCVKESGTKVFGRHNWKRRWFVLTQNGDVVSLAYYENETKPENKDVRLKGTVPLTNKYITTYLDDSVKKKPFCFALGPMVEDGITRTYYISCESEDDRLEWMEVLNSSLQGAPPSRTEERRRSVRLKAHKRQPSFTSSSEIGIEVCKYIDPVWRKQQWCDLVAMATRDNKEWKKVDTKDGITVARMAFEQNKCATVKIDGFVNASCDIVYEFLSRSTQKGGKFDFSFRDEMVLQELNKYPSEVVTQCHYDIPLPHVSARYCCILKSWLPYEFTGPVMNTDTCGLMFVSVKHDQAKIPKDSYLCPVGLSGVVLRPAPPTGRQRQSTSNFGSGERTQMTCILQVDAQGALHNMLKQSYKSKLLVFGLRSAYQHICNEIQQFVKLLDI